MVHRLKMFLSVCVSLLSVVLVLTPTLAVSVPDVPSHASLIQTVPYVSQETEFFGAYAAAAMIFEYFGRNASLPEVLYYSGVGYSQAYQEPVPLLTGGYPLSQLPQDFEFLGAQYGLASTFWYPDPTKVSDEAAWEQYWTYLTQNITAGKPILTSVNPFSMPSIRNQFNVSDEIWQRLPPSGHAIVIVGFNQTNKTVCYNDPAADVFGGNKSYGHYAWMHVDCFYDAVAATRGTPYVIISFTNTSLPLSYTEAFCRAHERNLQRLRGNHSAYDAVLTQPGTLVFGTHAVEALQQDFTTVRSQIQTISWFKLFGMLTKRYNRQLFFAFLRQQTPISPNIILFSTEHIFDRIALEKQYTASYLYYLQDLGVDVGDEPLLFSQETVLWTSFASQYTRFLNKGLLMSTPRAYYHLKQMNKILEDIFSVQQTVVN